MQDDDDEDLTGSVISSAFSTPTPAVELAVPFRGVKRSKPYGPLDHHFETRPLGKAEAASANRHLLLAFATGNIPFSFVENTHFKEFVKALRPSYSLPSRKFMAGTLLNSVDASSVALAKSELGISNFTTLITDGWENIRREK